MPIQRSANAFATGVRTGVLRTFIRSVLKISSKASTIWSSAVAHERRGVGESVAVSQQQFPGGLADPDAGWVIRDPCEVHGPGRDVDEEQQVEPAQRDRVDGREATCDGGLGTQELGPGHARALRGGVDAVLFEDSPHSGGSNAVAEADEFAGDAAAAPCRVVGAHLDDEATQLHRGAGPPGRPGGLGPVAGDAAWVPAHQGLWCDEPAGSLRSRQGCRDRA